MQIALVSVVSECKKTVNIKNVMRIIGYKQIALVSVVSEC